MTKEKLQKKLNAENEVMNSGTACLMLAVGVASAVIGLSGHGKNIISNVFLKTIGGLGLYTIAGASGQLLEIAQLENLIAEESAAEVKEEEAA